MVGRSVSRAGASAVFAFALASAACHGAAPLKLNEPPTASELKKRGAPATAMLGAEVIASLDDENATTLFARRGDAGLVLYSSGGHWNSRAVAPNGKPLGPAIDAGPATDLAPGMGSLKPTVDGWIAVWIELTGQNHALKMLALDPAGKPRGLPALVTQTGDEVRWIDALPNAKGALVVWEIPRGDRIEVDLVPIEGNAPKGESVQVFKDALGWEGIATERGMAIAAVMTDPNAPPPKETSKPRPKKGQKNKAEASEGEGTGAGKSGRVVLIELDASGHASSPTILNPTSTAQIDVEIANAGGKYVVAWTDERELDACVYVASVEPGGKVLSPPHRAMSPFGEEALVSLVGHPYDPTAKASGSRALLAWENIARSQDEVRFIRLATINADATVNAERATIGLATANGPPDLVPDGDGWASTTLAPAIEGTTTGKNGKDEVPIWPAYVRFGADLAVRGAEPVRADVFGAPEFVPYLTRGLSCRAGSCVTVATGGGAHAVLALVDLAARSSRWSPAGQRDADEGPPRPTFVGAIASGEHVAKVAATELAGGAKLAAWVTYFADGAKAKAKHEGDDANAARLEVRAIASGQASLSLAAPPVLISQKALSAGGVSLASAPGGKGGEAVLGWVAKEHGEPQVFVTKLGPDGKKIAQKGVTVIARRNKGKNGATTEASDVAVASDGQDGFIVSWVDTRDGDPEIYVAKVDRSMTKVIPEKRITEAVGDAADVQIFVRGKETLLAWSDARESPTVRRGDIYLARLETATLKKLGPETRIFASKEHSRSPQFSATPNGVLLSWIEEAPDGKKQAGESEAGLRLAQLDDRGNVVGAPLLVRPAGVVTSATIACVTKPCRGVITTASSTSGSEVLSLRAFSFEPGGRPSDTKVITSLTGALTEDPSPAFASTDPAALFFADDTVGGEGRVRWMQIAW